MAGHDAQQVQICMGKFSELETQMATVIAEMKPLKDAVTNFRNLDRNVNDFMTENRTERRILKEAVDKHNWRIMFAVALVGLILAALQLWIDGRNHQRNGSLHQPSVTAPTTKGQIDTAHNQQDAEGAHHGNW